MTGEDEGECSWKRRGKKSLRLAYVITDFPSASFFFYDCCQKKKSCFRCFQLWLKERMCDRVHRSSRIFWRNKLAAWFFGAVPRLLGSNPAPWKDEIWMTHWIHSNLRLIELKIPPSFYQHNIYRKEWWTVLWMCWLFYTAGVSEPLKIFNKSGLLIRITDASAF